MATSLTYWISGAALIVSIASFGLSAYVAHSNSLLARLQKRTDLLNRITEIQIQHRELKEKYKDFIAPKRSSLPEAAAPMIASIEKALAETEAFVEKYYSLFPKLDIDAAETEKMRHPVDVIFLRNAESIRLIDEYWKKYPRSSS